MESQLDLSCGCNYNSFFFLHRLLSLTLYIQWPLQSESLHAIQCREEKSIKYLKTVEWTLQFFRKKLLRSRSNFLEIIEIGSWTIFPLHFMNSGNFTALTLPSSELSKIPVFAQLSSWPNSFWVRNFLWIFFFLQISDWFVVRFDFYF